MPEKWSKMAHFGAFVLIFFLTRSRQLRGVGVFWRHAIQGESVVSLRVRNSLHPWLI
jgi:hypothetical protein